MLWNLLMIYFSIGVLFGILAMIMNNKRLKEVRNECVKRGIFGKVLFTLIVTWPVAIYRGYKNKE